MKTFVAFLVLTVAAASASHWGVGLGHGLALGHGIPVAPIAHVNPVAHVASGTVSVGPNGATIAGPAGSVSTDNGLHSGRAGAKIAGPSGTIAGWGAHGVVEGPAGVAGHGGWGVGHGAWGVGNGVWGAGHGVWGVGHVAPVAVGWGHAGVLGHGHGW